MSEPTSKLKIFGLWDKYQAARLAKQRLFKKHDEAIMKYTKVGSISGLLGGLLWTFTVGLVLLSFIAWHNEPFTYSSTFEALSVSLPYCILFTWLVGKQIARSIARKGLTGSNANRYRTTIQRFAYKTTFRRYTIYGLFLIFFIIVLRINSENDDLNILKFFLIISIIAVSTALLVAILRGMACLLVYCVNFDGNQEFKIWLWGLVSGAAIFFSGGFAILLLSKILKKQDGYMAGFSMFFWYLACLIAFTIALLQARNSAAVAKELIKWLR